MYRRFEAEERILTRDWSLSNGRAKVVVQPQLMSAETLLEGYRHANRRFYSPVSKSRRLSASPVGGWWALPLNVAYMLALFTSHR